MEGDEGARTDNEGDSGMGIAVRELDEPSPGASVLGAESSSFLSTSISCPLFPDLLVSYRKEPWVSVISTSGPIPLPAHSSLPPSYAHNDALPSRFEPET